MNAPDSPDQDAALREDIRLLGRILGDTVREHEGDDVFALVEAVRQTSLRFHREEDESARRELETIVHDLSPGRIIQIVRAFTYFSHLANIAEDQHHIRRSRQQAFADGAPREGTMAHALERARAAGVTLETLQKRLHGALIVPVLTAHPTEIRRRSTIDREMELAELLAERERGRLTPGAMDANGDAMRHAVLVQWQTHERRSTR